MSTEPPVGELRFIARLNSDVLPKDEPFGRASVTAGGTAIEGSDVVSTFDVRLDQSDKYSSWLTGRLGANFTRASGSSMTTDIVRYSGQVYIAC